MSKQEANGRRRGGSWETGGELGVAVSRVVQREDQERSVLCINSELNWHQKGVSAHRGGRVYSLLLLIGNLLFFSVWTTLGPSLSKGDISCRMGL